MSKTLIQRRSFLIGLGAALAAPAIVKAESLMKVKSLVLPSEHWVKRVAAEHGRFETYRNEFKWTPSNTDTDWRYVSRVCNIHDVNSPGWQAIKDGEAHRAAERAFWSRPWQERRKAGIDFASTGAPITPIESPFMEVAAERGTGTRIVRRTP